MNELEVPCICIWQSRRLLDPHQNLDLAATRLAFLEPIFWQQCSGLQYGRNSKFNGIKRPFKLRGMSSNPIIPREQGLIADELQPPVQWMPAYAVGASSSKASALAL